MAKILLVEDDNNLREIFEMRLKAEGYTIITAHDGEQALVVAMQEKPDLVISDVMMPKLSGFEMIETLKAAPDMKNVKVIMMTALGQAEDRSQGDRLGVDKYLVKSQVTLEDFVRVTKEVLEGPSGSTGPAASDGPVIPPTDGPQEPPAAPPEAPTAPPPATPPVAPPPPPAPPPSEPPAPAPPPPPPAPVPPPPVAPVDPPAAQITPPTPVVSPINTAPDTAPETPHAAATPVVETSTLVSPDPTPIPTPADSLPEMSATEMFTNDIPPADNPLGPLPGSTQEDELATVEQQINEFVSKNPTLADLETSEPEPTPPTAAETVAPAENSVVQPVTTPPSVPLTEAVPPSIPATEQTTIATSTNAESEPTTTEPTPQAETTTRQRVIQPINDPTKGPDLNALLAKEEEAQQAQEILKGKLLQAQQSQQAQATPQPAPAVPNSPVPQVEISPTGEVVSAPVVVESQPVPAAVAPTATATPPTPPQPQQPATPPSTPANIPPEVDPHSIAL